MTLEIPKASTSAGDANAWWDWLIKPSQSITGMSEKRQASLSAILALIFILLNALVASLTFRGSQFNVLIVFGIPAIFSLIAYFAIRTKYSFAGRFLLVMAFCGAVYLNIQANNLEITIGLLFCIPLVLSIGSAIVSALSLLLFTFLNIAAIVVLSSFGVIMPTNINMIIGLVTLFGFTLAFINYFRTNIEAQELSDLRKINQETNENRTNLQVLVDQRTKILDRRANRLESAALVAKAASEIRELSDLLSTISNQISERFGFYHVAIFLADEDSRHLNLVAASSEGGQKMLARGHRLAVGREGIVGFTAAQKRSRIAQSVELDDIFLNNPDLPTTRSEVALPLQTQRSLIGVLDIQSEDENAFTGEDLSILQTMTDQIAMAIENITLFEQSRATLKSLETANVEKMNKAWQEKLSGQIIGFTYTPLGISVVDQENDLSEINIDSGRVLKIPILLRNEEIGSISLLRNMSESLWTDTEREMAKGIAIQLGLAIDNARLLEEAQGRAVREQTINEFSSLLSQSLDIDTLLQKAVREVYRMPQVSQVSLFINPDQEN